MISDFFFKQTTLVSRFAEIKWCEMPSIKRGTRHHPVPAQFFEIPRPNKRRFHYSKILKIFEFACKVATYLQRRSRWKLTRMDGKGRIRCSLEIKSSTLLPSCRRKLANKEDSRPFLLFTSVFRLERRSKPPIIRDILYFLPLMWINVIDRIDCCWFRARSITISSPLFLESFSFTVEN